MPERTCTITDCDKPLLYRGWCQMHLSRWRRHGHTDAVLELEPLTRFHQRVEKSDDPNGCWLWTGSGDDVRDKPRVLVRAE